MRTIIADDEEIARNCLSKLLENIENVDLVCTVDDSTRLEAALMKHKPDMLFLDVEMPGVDGLKLLDNIRSYNAELCIVMVSAYERYMKQAIKYNVYSFLLKPVDEVELRDLIKRFSEKEHKEEESVGVSKMKIPVSDGFVFLDLDDLLMLEAHRNYTKIITVDRKEYLSSYNMGKLHEKLPSARFFRVNRRCVLNSKYLHSVNKKKHTCIVLVNNDELEVKTSSSFLSTINKLA